MVASGETLALTSRTRISELESRIEELKAAREATRAELRTCETDYDFAERKVAHAVMTVLATGAPALIKAAEAARAEFEGAAAVCRFVRWGVSDSIRQPD